MWQSESDQQKVRSIQENEYKKEKFWKLSTVASNSAGREWDIVFTTENDAWAFFLKSVKTEGMESMVGMPTRK